MSVIADLLAWLQGGLQGLGEAVSLRVREEPVLTVGLFRAAVTMLVGFGLGWSGEQVALMVAFVEAVTAWVARRQVTPTTSPSLAEGQAVRCPTAPPPWSSRPDVESSAVSDALDAMPARDVERLIAQAQRRLATLLRLRHRRRLSRDHLLAAGSSAADAGWDHAASRTGRGPPRARRGDQAGTTAMASISTRKSGWARPLTTAAVMTGGWDWSPHTRWKAA